MTQLLHYTANGLKAALVTLTLLGLVSSLLAIRIDMASSTKAPHGLRFNGQVDYPS